MNISERITSKTPRFFRRVRNVGLALVGAAAAITTAPVALPAIIVTIAGYAATAGTVMAAVSQLVYSEPDPLESIK